MSSKPRRSRHRAGPVPWARVTPVVLDEEYQRQVDRSTSKLERQYVRAQKRVEQAEGRLQRAKQDTHRKVKATLLAQLEAELQARRDELEEYRRMMVGVPASAAHRGTKSFRPVPVARHDSGA